MKAITRVLASRKRELAILILSMVYFLIIRLNISTGIYQDDEIAHYFNMLQFWKDPRSILTSWAKPGYKILYVFPALLGEKFLMFFNAFISALTVLFVFLTLRASGEKNSIIGAAMCLAQPFFLHIATRNYAEVPAAFLISVACYLLMKERYYPFSLIVSYLFLLRTELGATLPFAAILLLYRKKIIPFMLLGTFPVIYLFISFIVWGDPLHIIREASSLSAEYQEIYPRRGFFHFIEMAPVIWGIVPAFLMFASLFLIWKTQWRIPFTIFFVPYFVFHLLNNIEGLEVGYPTGGNLRYMVAISPIVALCATSVLFQNFRLPTKLIISIIFVALAIFFLSYKHNNVAYTEERNMAVIPICIVTSVLWLASDKMLPGIIGIFTVFSVIFNFNPIKLSKEHEALQRAAVWTRQHIDIKSAPLIMVAHPTFLYYYGESPIAFKNLLSRWGVDSATIRKSPPGTYILWENHYFYRPRHIKTSTPVEFFLSRPDTFKKVNEWIGNPYYFVLFYKAL